MISGAEVNLREYLGSGLLIEQNVNAGQMIFVFDGYRIEGTIIYT
jgi:hypothetical protein